jgi:hypothetical protein
MHEINTAQLAATGYVVLIYAAVHHSSEQWAMHMHGMFRPVVTEIPYINVQTLQRTSIWSTSSVSKYKMF